LKGFGFYMLEPGTNSSLLTVPILPTNKAFIARMVLIANSEKHPTGGDWDYSWERWQVFRTDLKPGVSNLTPVPASPSGIKS
jgi:hypothetical protein